MAQVKQEVLADLGEEADGQEKVVAGLFKETQKRVVRQMVLESSGASTAAASTEVRPITGEIGMLSRTHGSAVFTRGETQALAVATLGTPVR